MPQDSHCVCPGLVCSRYEWAFLRAYSAAICQLFIWYLDIFRSPISDTHTCTHIKSYISDLMAKPILYKSGIRSYNSLCFTPWIIGKSDQFQSEIKEQIEHWGGLHDISCLQSYSYITTIIRLLHKQKDWLH